MWSTGVNKCNHIVDSLIVNTAYVLRMQWYQLNNITAGDDGNDVVRGICDDDGE